jgi:hypothetical protein
VYYPRDIFHQNATVYEIAIFVANHPQILSMANNIYKSKQTNWNQASILFEEQSTKNNEKQSLDVCITRLLL